MVVRPTRVRLTTGRAGQGRVQHAIDVERETAGAGGASFVSALGLTLLGSVLTLGATAINSVIVSRSLGPEGRGTYVLGSGAVATLGLLLSGGLQYANTYWASRDRSRAPALFWHSLLWVMAASTALATVYAIWPVWLRAMLGGDGRRELGWLVLSVTAASVLTELLVSLLAGLRRFHAYNAVRVVIPLALAPANLVMVVFFSAGVVPLVATWAAVYAAAALMAVLLVRFRMPLPFQVNRRTFVASFTLGGRGFVAAVAGVLLLRLDLFLVGWWAGAAAAAFYGTAILLADLTLRLPDVAGRVLFPAVAAADHAAGVALSARVLRHTLAATLIAALALALVGQPLIMLAFGAAFAPAYPALLALLPGTVALSLSIVVNHYLGGQGFPRITVIAPVAALIINVAVDLVTIPRWGATGASIGSSVGYWVMAALLLRVFARESGMGLATMLLLSRQDLREMQDMVRRRRSIASPASPR